MFADNLNETCIAGSGGSESVTVGGSDSDSAKHVDLSIHFVHEAHWHGLTKASASLDAT